MPRTSRTLVLIVALLVSSTRASAQVERAELAAGGGSLQDEFGAAVALDGERVLVGAPLDDHTARTDAGSAYVFERGPGGTWTQITRLSAADRASSDFFGGSVALLGGRALVGADGDDDQGSLSGSVYAFERDGAGTWLQTAKLHAPDGAAFDIFGEVLSLSGERLLIGAPGHAGTAGAAYLFERRADASWHLAAELGAADAAANAFLGNAVVLAGERAVVGAFSDDGVAPDAGAVYVFQRVLQPGWSLAGGRTPGGRTRSGTWRQVAKLTALDAGPGDAFGSSVALSGERLLVGAHGDDEAGLDAGAAYLFERANGVWTQVAKLTPGAAGDFAGAAVALDGERALLGAFAADAPATDAGLVYAFERVGAAWVARPALGASDGLAADAFGSALALQGARLVAGAFRGNGLNADSGSAYVFEF